MEEGSALGHAVRRQIGARRNGIVRGRVHGILGRHAGDRAEQRKGAKANG
jgi:hypothetical protein